MASRVIHNAHPRDTHRSLSLSLSLSLLLVLSLEGLDRIGDRIRVHKRLGRPRTPERSTGAAAGALRYARAPQETPRSAFVLHEREREREREREALLSRARV